ncbi:MAG: hypothetical protein P8175_03335 [Deltaproteobacteria bacterium]|jgi:hypothetical protein
MSSEKSPNREGDVVLIYYRDEPALYARIEDIAADHKRGWYQVTLRLLTIPAQVVSWILREEYLNGTPFTMGGQPVKMEKIGPLGGEEEPGETRKSPEPEGGEKSAKVIPFKKSS